MISAAWEAIMSSLVIVRRALLDLASTWRARWTFSMTRSGSAVQTRGLGSAFVSARQRLIAAQILQGAARSRGRRRIEVVDIGLRPWDALAMGLPVKNVRYDKPRPVADYVRAREDGAYWEAWLQHRRVEPNAMRPGALIRWLDEQVKRHGELKGVPHPDVVAERTRSRVEEKIERQGTGRVPCDAREAIRKPVQERVAEAVARLPGEGGLTGSVQGRPMDRRNQHWTDVVERLADDLLGGGLQRLGARARSQNSSVPLQPRPTPAPRLSFAPAHPADIAHAGAHTRVGSKHPRPVRVYPRRQQHIPLRVAQHLHCSLLFQNDRMLAGRMKVFRERQTLDPAGNCLLSWLRSGICSTP
jgi:hypothetical protein